MRRPFSCTANHRYFALIRSAAHYVAARCLHRQQFGFTAKDLKTKYDYLGKYSLIELRNEGYSMEEVASAGFSSEEIVGAFRNGMRPLGGGDPSIPGEGDPHRKVGERVFCEGKLGHISELYDQDGVWNCLKIRYDDGSKNREMSEGGYLRFANRPGLAWPTCDVYVFLTLAECRRFKGCSVRECLALDFELKDVVNEFGLQGNERIMETCGLRMEKLDRGDHPEHAIGAEVITCGKIGIIAELHPEPSAWNLIKVHFHDGTDNKDMFLGYLRFANAGREKYLVEDVWVRRSTSDQIDNSFNESKYGDASKEKSGR